MRRPGLWCLPWILAWILGIGDAAAESVLESRPMSGPKAGVAALILGGGDGGALWAAAHAVPRSTPGGVSGIDLAFQLDGSRLLEGRDPATFSKESLKLEIHIYAMARSGELAATLSRRVRLPLAEWGSQLLTGGLHLFGSLDLEPGAYRMRILAWEPVSQRYALRGLEVFVPKGRGKAPAVASFDVVEGAWTFVDLGAGQGSPNRSFAALPVLVTERERAFDLTLAEAASKLEARLLNSSSEEVARLPVELAEEGGATRATLQVPVLESGPHRLELRPDKGSRTLQEVFVVASEFLSPSRSQPLAWTEVRRLGTAEATAPSSSPSSEAIESEEGRRKVAAIIREYRRGLEILATGDLDEALDFVRRVELAALGQGKERLKGRARLVEGEKKVGEVLLQAVPEAGIPLVWLHLEMHERYLEERGDPFLSSAARERVEALVDGYLDRVEHEMSGALAAEAMVRVGLAVDRSGLPQSARRFLERAAELDPDHRMVLPYLAFWFERQGRSDKAVDWLREFLRVEPQSREGWLRLAVNLGRDGHFEEAESWLRKLLHSEVRDRWTVLAYQEQARQWMTEGRFDEVVQSLEVAVERMPQETRLRILLGYALERHGQRSRSRDVLRDLEADAGRATPRHLYAEPPGFEEDGAKSRFRGYALARLPALAQGLAALEVN